MEDIWKKFKEETKEHMQKINEFLNEVSSIEKPKLIEPEKPSLIPNFEKINETSANETSQMPQQTVWIEKSPNEISGETSKIPEQIQQVVLENETSQNSKLTRKEVYGKMRELVKEIMEKENVSRAQAYRKAKKRLLEKSQ